MSQLALLSGRYLDLLVDEGGRLRGDAQITQGVGVFALVDVRALGVRVERDDRTRQGIELMIVATAGLRTAF